MTSRVVLCLGLRLGILVGLAGCSQSRNSLERFEPDGTVSRSDAKVTDACTPLRCDQMECGEYDDGCGETIFCGTCLDGQQCQQGQCTCTPTTCAASGAQCGEIPDGCGGTLDCGSCENGQMCGGAGANQCGENMCQPRTCAQAGAECGRVSDGCGGTLRCGGCSGSNTCSSNQCVCQPRTCAQAGAECGRVSDGCGGTLRCGGCSGNDACSSNQCVCQPRTCAQAGADCGQVSDGCGGTLRCGGCPSGQRCSSRQCVFPPHHGTTRVQLAYIVMAHPDDEMHGWAILERSTDNYSVIIHGTRGEATGYCKNGFPGYQPGLGEAPPGNTKDYKNRSCKQLRIGSSRAFWNAAANFDSAFRPTPTEHHARTGVSLPSGTPGRGCAVSSNRFDMWIGKNSTLVYFDLGDGNLKECEVQWMISQIRRLRGTYYIPALREHSVVAVGHYNDIDGDPVTVDPRYPNCSHYGHPDHYAVHRGVFHTNYGTRGPQIGRTCSADPDVPDARRKLVVDDYSKIMSVAADGTRRGAVQVYYGWLMGPDPWPTGNESAANASNPQSFWQVH